VAKRRRCKDKLPHHEHEWGQQSDVQSNVKSGIFSVVDYGGGRLRHVPQTFWCPGIETTEEKQ
jgi:hypothetical protein